MTSATSNASNPPEAQIAVNAPTSPGTAAPAPSGAPETPAQRGAKGGAAPKFGVGTLQHALAEAEERRRTHSDVAYSDLNGGRGGGAALPYEVVTPELRAARGWEAREASEIAYRAQRAAAPAPRKRTAK